MFELFISGTHSAITCSDKMSDLRIKYCLIKIFGFIVLKSNLLFYRAIF